MTVRPAFPTGISAEDKKKEQQRLKEWIVEVVEDAAERGSDIYNQGAYLHCYLYFQATLLSVMQPLLLLDDRQLNKRVQAALSRGTEVEKDWQAAIVLRTALNDIRNTLSTDQDGKRLPLFTRLGGEETVRAIVRTAFNLAYADRRVNLTRNGDYPYTDSRAERLEQLGVEAIQSLPPRRGAEPAGGYSGRNMETAHRGMRITRSEFNAAKKHLDTALRWYGVPQPEIDELMYYVEKERENIVGK
jgi:hemoglobin